ncbi:ribosome-inactivating family protein [Microbulbifer sp. TRSA005]|uniref:ribosome-inactivating family protein n=1 Tax=unclassified Microbulbifer TaxID=2619833 RepID=UPI00403955D4
MIKLNLHEIHLGAYSEAIDHLKERFRINRTDGDPARIFIPINLSEGLGVTFYIRNSDVWLTGYSIGSMETPAKNYFHLPSMSGVVTASQKMELPFDGSYPSMGFSTNSNEETSIYYAYNTVEHIYKNSNIDGKNDDHMTIASSFGKMAIFLSESIRFKSKIFKDLKGGSVTIGNLLEDAKNWQNYSNPKHAFADRVDIKHLDFI